jgi:hypothetical protein
MEQPAEPFLEPGQELRLTILGSARPAIPGVLLEMTDPVLRIRLAAETPFAAAVKVEATGVVLLGDVCHCYPGQDGFLVGVMARHKLSLLPELQRLNDALRQHQPQPVEPAVRKF